jgi:glycine/D-amino acid oxidase-like deaminating enzyme
VDSLAKIDEALPGSASVSDIGSWGQVPWGRVPWGRVPDGAVAVIERHAGFISPAALRDAVLATLSPVRGPVDRVTPDPAIVLTDGTVVPYDVVVLATGPWTPSLLLRSGLPSQGLRVRHIQYGIHPAVFPGVGAFVDDITGLYGRPYSPGTFLLGLPSRLVPDPDSPPVDASLVATVCATAGVPAPERVVSSTDCYHDEPGLVLRGGPSVWTFTGGSGGAAKTVLAQSRLAARTLLNLGLPSASQRSTEEVQ